MMTDQSVIVNWRSLNGFHIAVIGRPRSGLGARADVHYFQINQAGGVGTREADEQTQSQPSKPMQHRQV
jgi:hypothetical protein